MQDYLPYFVQLSTSHKISTKVNTVSDEIRIHSSSRTPKYKQLVEILSSKIKNGVYTQDKLPSINYLSSTMDISRDTVQKAYNELVKRKLVESVPGKGHFVNPIVVSSKPRIFLLFNKLSPHKKIVYDSFMATLDDKAEVDFHVYNNDFTIFQQLLSHNHDQYSYYVIIPHFFTDGHLAKDIIDRIPKKKLLLLDKGIEGISGKYACAYQDFEKDIYGALNEVKNLLNNYKQLKLLFPAKAYQPREITLGFKQFCIDHNFKGKLVPDLSKDVLAAGDVYITMMDDDLVHLIKKVKNSKLEVGKDIGILSYNESPLKEILLDGITVMSSDYKHLGATAANMLLENRKEFVPNPFRLIIRNSL